MAAQVLVTGATGFIGRFLVRLLLRENLPVRVLSRSKSKAYRLFGDRVEIVQGDLLDAVTVGRAAAGTRIIYHVGGAYLFGSRNRRELLETNLQGTRNVMEAAWRNRAEKVVHTSTASLLARQYGLVQPGDFPVKPLWFAHYKRSKWLAEQCALEWAARGLPVTVASPTSPIGPEDESPTPTGRMIVDFLNERFPAVARTGLNFVCVSECAEGIYAVGRRGRTGSRYVIGGSNLWLADFIRMLARQTRRQAPKWTVPWPMIAAAGVIGELAGLVSRNGDRVCMETAYYARKVQFFDLSKTRDELGWQPGESVEPAARRAIDWFCANSGSRGFVNARNLSLSDAVVH